MSTRAVYVVEACYKNDTMPYIKFRTEPNDQGLTYELLNYYIKLGRMPPNYEPLTLIPSAEPKDLDYFDGCSVGIFSERAVHVLRPLMAQCFDFVEIRLRRKRDSYFAILVKDTIDALDVAHSDVLRSEEDPSRILIIHKYTFSTDRLVDPTIFAIPEARNQWMFCTSSVPDIATSAGLVGIRFHDTAERFA